jgi:hypothetical protein
MQHSINRAAFRDAAISRPFFRLYTLLVSIEIALKDAIRPWRPGHDLDGLLHLAITDPLRQAAVRSAATTLWRCIAQLKCTARDGSTVRVNPSQYPDLRYVRHIQDFPDGSIDSNITTALNAATQLLEELKRAGVTP